MSEKFDRNVEKFWYMVGNCRKNSTSLMKYFNEDVGKLFRQGGSSVRRHPMWLSEKLLGFCISVCFHFLAQFCGVIQRTVLLPCVAYTGESIWVNCQTMGVLQQLLKQELFKNGLQVNSITKKHAWESCFLIRSPV